MAATFRTRPWQLAPVRPACRLLDPGQSQWVSVGCGFASPLRSPAFAGTAWKSTGHKPNVRQEIARSRLVAQHPLPMRATLQDMKMKARSDKPIVAFLAPYTVVPLQSKPKDATVRQWIWYRWQVVKIRVRDLVQRVGMSWSAREKWYKRSKISISRQSIKRTAMSLHQALAGALARGDKRSLAMICDAELYRTLANVIDRRPRDKRLEWELVGYSKRWFPRMLLNPRIVDLKWVKVPVSPEIVINFRQAVVRVESEQLLREYSRTFPKQAPDVKDMTLVEYIVLWQEINSSQRYEKPWFIYSTLKPTEISELKTELDLLESGKDQETDKWKEKYLKEKNEAKGRG